MRCEGNRSPRRRACTEAVSNAVRKSTMSLECATEMAWGGGAGAQRAHKCENQNQNPERVWKGPFLRCCGAWRCLTERLGTPAGGLLSSGVRIQTSRDAGTFAVSFLEQFPRACPTAICCTHWKGPTCDKLESGLLMLHRPNFTPEFFHKVRHVGPRPYYLQGTWEQCPDCFKDP